MFMYEPPTKLKLTSVEGNQSTDTIPWSMSSRQFRTYMNHVSIYSTQIQFKCLILCSKKPEFQEAFQLFDSRGDGKIHVAQIGDALRALGQNPTESDVKKCTLHLKPDERISFEVFLPIYQVGTMP